VSTASPAAPAQDELSYASARGRWVLLATVLGSAMASIDATVVGIALPAIGKDFHASLSTLQWVVTAYTLTLAGLLLLAGSLGDRYGRKKIFLIGVVWFALASVLCGIAPNAPVLIAARAVQGIFYINLPLAILVVAVSLRHVPESVDPQETGTLDYPGAVLVTLGLIGLTYGLINGSAVGWTNPGSLIALIAGVVLLAAFILWERRAPEPLLPLSLFSSLQFTAANVLTFVVYGALGGILFLLPLQLEQVSGYTPLEAGVALLPVTVIMLLLSARSGALAARIGPRLQMSVGPLVIGVGFFLFARIGPSAGPSGNYVTEVLPAVLVFGFGLAINVAPLTSTVLAAAPAENAGMASAVNNDVARAAGLIAVAVLPAAAGLTGSSYLHPEEFSAGFRTASFISGALCLLAGVLAVLTIRNPRRAAAPAAEPVSQFHCGLDAPPPAPVPAPQPAAGATGR